MTHEDPEYVIHRAADGKLACRTIRNLKGSEKQMEEPEEVETNEVAIEDLKRPQLLELAKKAGLKVDSKAKNADIVKILKGEPLEEPEAEVEKAPEE